MGFELADPRVEFPIKRDFTYLSSVLENYSKESLAFGSILGLYRDYSTPKGLKVTDSTTRYLGMANHSECSIWNTCKAMIGIVYLDTWTLYALYGCVQF